MHTETIRQESIAVSTAATAAEPELRKPLNAFCVTLYSESVGELEASLAALLVSIETFHSIEGNRDSYSLICIVADGRTRLAPGVLSLLGAIGFLDTHLSHVDGADLFSGLHRIDEMLRRLGARKADIAPDGSAAPMIRAMICLKDCNRGKLHSHQFFFDVLCRAVEPTYCFQIDAGTTLARDAVRILIDRLRSAKSIGAIAPRVMPSVPAIEDDLLQSWQYVDFACRKGVFWPFEVVTGYLSVLPGQASAYRWSALRGNEELTEDDSLHAYLKGVGTTEPLAIVMYLAEDRVIGNQLILSRGRSWRLAFAADAHATTDSCTSYRELFHQRRRWNNGALACRLWLLGQWPAILKRNDRDPAAKIGLSLAMLGQVLFGVLEWFAPALLIAYLEVVSSALLRHETSPLLQLGLLAFVILEIPFFLRRGAIPLDARRRGWEALRIAWRVGAPLAFVLLLAMALPPTAAAILLCPVLALLPMMLVLPARSLPSLARARLHPLPDMVLANLMYAYSYWNLHDVSWGTKGLRTQRADAALYTKLRTLRNFVLSAWLITNLAVGSLAIALGGILSDALNPVIEIGYGIELTLILIALIGLGAALIKRRKDAPPNE